MWKDSLQNIVVTFQTTILKIVGFYVRRLANVLQLPIAGAGAVVVVVVVEVVVVVVAVVLVVVFGMKAEIAVVTVIHKQEIVHE